MSLRRQIWVVLLSYLTRLRWAIVSGLSALSLHLIGVGCGEILHVRYYHESPLFFLIFIGDVCIFGSVVTALFIIIAHARQQLMGPMTRVIPNTRTANLIVAYTMLFTLTLALCMPAYSESDLSFPSLFMIVLSFATLIAWAICNPWLTLIAVTAIVLPAYSPAYSNALEFCISLIVSKDVKGEFVPLNGIVFENWKKVEHIQFVLRILLLLANILCLIVLERLSRPKRPVSSPGRLWWKLSRALDRRSHTTPERRHPFIQACLARSLHRRFAIHDWRAAVFLAGLVSALTALISYIAGNQSDPLISIVTLLAVLPGALAAVGWRDRWGSYEFETLYPAKHQQFVGEMVIVLALDIIEYWIASLAAILLTILALRPEMLRESQLWIAITGCAMMQILWIGGIALAGQRRQTVPFAAGLGIVALSMLLAVYSLRGADSLPNPSHFVAFSTIEMLVGFLFLAIATLSWRRRAAV